jgi:hypothetical protein
MKSQYYNTNNNYYITIDPTPKSKGLGDTVKKILDKTGISKIIPQKKGCGCARRQEKLNKMFPYS